MQISWTPLKRGFRNRHDEIWADSLFARKILRLGGYKRYRLYNVDVPVAQAYIYERDVFPLAHVLAYEESEQLGYELLDSVESCQYKIPQLRSLWLDVNIRKEAPVASFQDKIDPDIIYTKDGDPFLFPYLAHRAFANGILDKFSLSRRKYP